MGINYLEVTAQQGWQATEDGQQPNGDRCGQGHSGGTATAS